ncbi:uncharacterized protein E0L32_002762 [Thyridium curvatum]|uniref:MYND-type domain-containing protein n=1 Tax=Thyridium curvatum TaxID=1093900 RepID=A0A507BFI3_9PEZI|nr:uncharacterized protein E0L32_002762 [Thyridium curvatum]TPX18253.1 hypothetical protein E0L32_002762 [Thyridium curvatum]
MLTPTVANAVSFFYPIGNTPAVDLPRYLPQGVDADVLLLGCGDVRNILSSVYAETGLPPRKLDFTCCDVVEDLLARNAVFFSFLVDGAYGDLHQLWAIYYHLYLDDTAVSTFRNQIKKLLSAASSYGKWHNSTYGGAIRFCDEATFDDFRAILDKYSSEDEAAQRSGIESSLRVAQALFKEKFGGNPHNVTSMRSAAPLGLKAGQDLGQVYDHYWKTGLTGQPIAGVAHPNPLFASSVTQEISLHYGTDPVLGYQLATAFAPLAERSPLRPDSLDSSEQFKTFKAAKVQFDQWIKALRDRITKGDIVIRFVTADALALCNTLAHRKACPSEAESGWPRRQFDARKLDLHALLYGKDGKGGPTSFDAIDTSNLADHLGTLNILVAASPLLKELPWATLSTEFLLKRGSGDRKNIDELLCGDGRTLSMLLGLAPMEYWTNATAVSSVDEFFTSIIQNNLNEGADAQVHNRICWKLANQVLGLQHSRARLTISPSDLASVVLGTYKEMFASEDPTKMMGISREQLTQKLRSTAYPHFHRGSLAALLGRIRRHVNTDWTQFCETFVQMVFSESSIMMSSQHAQDFAAHLHMWGLHSESWLQEDIYRNRAALGSFNAWKEIPELVAVTFVVPRSAFNKLFGLQGQGMVSPTLQISFESATGDQPEWQNLYTDLHLNFGKVVCIGSPEEDSFAIKVEEDARKWSGDAPVVASFYMLSSAAQTGGPKARISLLLLHTAQNIMVYAKKFGQELKVFQTTLGDKSSVYFTKFLPGQTRYPFISTAVAAPTEDTPDKISNTTSLSVVNIDKSGRFTNVIGHVDIETEQGKTLLEEKVPITLRQTSPFDIDIVFGKDELVCPLRFITPVSQDGARTRIARKSSYVEVVAPFADPVTANILADYIFPTTLGPNGFPTTHGVPHINLDTQPILEVSETASLSWLTTLSSFMFSTREKQLREDAQKAAHGLAANPRLNLKESLFTLFMLASGLQGGQTGLFAINHPERGGIHALILVSALRIDAANASVVADAAVLPFTPDMLQDEALSGFLAYLRLLEICTLTVDDAELALWKRVLPALAERCRTWRHDPSSCEYGEEGASIPLGLEPGGAVLCSCGRGVFPDEFLAVPEWSSASRFATRVAISPVFAVEDLEEVMDKKSAAAAIMGRAGGSGSGASRTPQQGSGAGAGASGSAELPYSPDTCWTCRAKEAKGGGSLKKCMRCLKARYCSAECQKKDWRKHRMECEEA